MKTWSAIKEIGKTFFDRDWTKEEKVLLITDCILLGIVMGAIWSPKRAKHSVFGSYNSENSYVDSLAEEEE